MQVRGIKDLQTQQFKAHACTIFMFTVHSGALVHYSFHSPYYSLKMMYISDVLCASECTTAALPLEGIILHQQSSYRNNITVIKE